MSKKAELDKVADCKEVWAKSRSVCFAINRLEGSGILLPGPIIPFVQHFSTCENCKSEFAFMHKRCLAILQECAHGKGFLSAGGCVHLRKRVRRAKVLAKLDPERLEKMKIAIRYLLERGVLGSGSQARLAEHFGVTRQRVSQLAIAERKRIQAELANAAR